MAEMNVKEEKWVKIPDESDIWRPEEPGDEIQGKYVKKEAAPYKGRPNCKYTLETGPNEEDHVAVYGTVGLKRKMAKVPEGYNVKIVYQGEKPSTDPIKKPFKLFDVYAWMSPEDPVYKKLYPDGGPHEGGPTLAGSEDPDAMNMIEHYIMVVKDAKGKGHQPTALEVLGCAEAESLPAEDVTRIKVQLAELVKQDKIKEGAK